MCRDKAFNAKPAHWVKICKPMSLVVTFRQCNREDCIVPAELQAIHVVKALERVHVEVIVLHFVRSVLNEIVNHNLRECQVRHVGEGLVFTTDYVNRNASESESRTDYLRRNLISTQNGISSQINHPDWRTLHNCSVALFRMEIENFTFDSNPDGTSVTHRSYWLLPNRRTTNVRTRRPSDDKHSRFCWGLADSMPN